MILIIIWLGVTFVGLTFVNRLLGAAFFTDRDVEILNQLTVFRTVKFMNLYDVPTLNLQFFTEGLPHLFSWQYSYFGGSYEIIQFMLYAVSMGVVFGLFLYALGAITKALP